MKKLFSRIQTRLVNLSIEKPEGHALKRINTLSGLINGMIRKGSSHLPDLGSGLPQNINADSKTVAAKRFVENKWIDFDTHYLPYLSAFLKGILAYSQLRQGVILVIDGSQTGKDNAALMISLVWQNRGIPLCWYVKKGAKGHFKAEDHQKVLEHAIQLLLPLIPKNIPVTLLGDGEFDGIGLQQMCIEIGWNYVLRTACNTVLFENDQEFKAKDIGPDEQQNCAFIPAVEFTKLRFKYVNFVCWHDLKRHDDPIFLVSNFQHPGDIIDFYDQRYSIECLFKDLKSTSFYLDKTRLKKADEVSNLIMIAALAFILLTVLAIQYDQAVWRKKVQRVRKDRKVLSFFTFAYRLIDYFLDYEVSFNFSFQFSKNESDFYYPFN